MLTASNVSLDVSLGTQLNLTDNTNNYNNNNNNNNYNISSSNSSSSISHNFSLKPQSSRLNSTGQQEDEGQIKAGQFEGELEGEDDYAMEDMETDTERMQADLYDDDDEDDDDDVDDGLDDEETSLFSADEDEDDEEPEQLPDPKGLVSPAAEEEEDMGYDEDDERLALERPRTTRPRADEEHFVNEEGSGAGPGSLGRFKPSNSYRLSQLENIRKKLLEQEAAGSVAGVGAAVAVPSTAIDLRESSGHFANDDEDGEDNDDGVDDEYADNGDGAAGAGFFGSQRSSSGGAGASNHYFRKNSNDAIKIISTPLGKVGIVYQQTPTDSDLNSQQHQQKQQGEQQAQQKPATQFTDFDALSPDPESSHRFPSPHPKITPVLTPDGKVALLYRGDSESSKYEPIRNLTHKFTKPSATVDDNSGSDDDDSSDDSVYTDGEDETAGDKPAGASAVATPKPLQPEIVEPPAHAPNGGGSFIIRPTSDSLLPMINRPLSEVLGIKKNQFQETRVREQIGTGSLAVTEATPRSLLAQPAQQPESETKPKHFLTKVNLAEYPTSKQRDFDFSRDNTMLDERSRVRELEQQREREREHNEATSKGSGSGGTEAHTIANEQLLSKTEVINLAIIPQFDEDMERLQRMHESSGMGTRRHHRARHRHKQTEEELSGIHCVMQVMMGIAAVSTVFGMLGTFFKQRILDQLRLMHW